MNPTVLAQLLVIFLSGLGFSILFNVHGFRIFINAAGAVAAWIIYLLIYGSSGNVFWAYLITTTLVAVCCEVLARLIRTPTTLMLVPMIVPPLVPGGDLYNTCYNLITGDGALAYEYGIRLVLEIAAINFGIILAATFVKLVRYGLCILQEGTGARRKA